MRATLTACSVRLAGPHVGAAFRGVAVVRSATHAALNAPSSYPCAAERVRPSGRSTLTGLPLASRSLL